MLAPDTLTGRRVLVPGAGTGLGRATVTALRCDIRDPAQVETMLDTIWAEAPLDILVNNLLGDAAQNDTATLLDWSDAQWDALRPAPAPRPTTEPA